jgi:D-inositol-3-phosphate glycosyltransferase
LKKIAILGPAHPLRGGLATFDERLAREFQFNGYEVVIFTFSLQYPSFLFPGKTQYSDAKVPTDLNIDVCINSINPLSWFTAAKKISRFQPDLLICRYWLPFMAPCLGTILKFVQKKIKTTVVGLIDNIIPHEHRVGDRLLSNYFVNQVDKYVVMSHAVAEELKSFKAAAQIKFLNHPVYDVFGQKVEMIHSKKHLNLNTNQPYILFFGFIRAYKGLDLLLEAMATPQVKALNIQLIVAGEFYEDKSKYDLIIEQNQLQKNIIFFDDYIVDDEVKYYFGAADLVVQPYKTATQSGISQISYHFEKPMVVTDVGGLSEIVPHGKCGYVTPVDATAIANAIVDFYTLNPDFSQNIQQEKKKFDWSYMVNGFLKFLE